MADPQQQASLNTLLKWSIENSEATNDGSTSARPSGGDGPGSEQDPSRGPTRLDPGILDAVFGGPSDAELMKASMGVICNPEMSLDDKLTAFDNFEQLVESIDNANNLAALDLWSPLIELLESPEAKLRRMACWCIGTAVQNNEKAQERALVVGAVPRLVRLATGRRADGEEAENGNEDPQEEKNVRRKACYGISSAIRNYQPGANAAVEALPEAMKERYNRISAADMEAVDKLMEELRGYTK